MPRAGAKADELDDREEKGVPVLTLSSAVCLDVEGM
jgi:hypothetical protein